MLAVEDLRFAHEGQSDRYRFSFVAQPGEVTAISGPSGSGKSTLFDLIAGFLVPVEGRIMLDGRNLVPLPPEERPVSLLLQADNLFDHLSAGRNVALGLPQRTSKDDAKTLVEQAMRDVGLAGLAPQRSATLSGGQKQRVALARTLLRNRAVLLLDEPFSALDDETRERTRQLVRDLTTQHNWHTILVSHHVEDVSQLASRRYRLSQCELKAY